MVVSTASDICVLRLESLHSLPHEATTSTLVIDTGIKAGYLFLRLTFGNSFPKYGD